MSKAVRAALQTHAGIENLEPKEAIQLLLADITVLALAVNRREVIHLSGPRLMMPRGGLVRIYVVSPVTTAGSDVSNYQTIEIIRNGRAESGILHDTRTSEIRAYVSYPLGAIQVGQNDVLEMVVTSVGTIAPTMTAEDMTIRAELNPRET